MYNLGVGADNIPNIVHFLYVTKKITFKCNCKESKEFKFSLKDVDRCHIPDAIHRDSVPKHSWFWRRIF